MPFMIPQYFDGKCYSDPNDPGWVPSDVASDAFDGDAELDCASGWFCRLSAPGYMDCTEWDGPHASEAQARAAIRETFDVCDECGTDLLETVDRCPKCDPFAVVVSDRDDGPCEALMVVEGPGAAEWAERVHMTSDGSSWESDGPEFAYAVVLTRPGCVAECQTEMSDAQWDLSEFSEPTAEECEEMWQAENAD